MTDKFIWAVLAAGAAGYLWLLWEFHSTHTCVRWEPVTVVRYEKWGNTLEPHAEVENVCQEWRAHDTR